MTPQERLRNPCKCCGIPLSYSGEVKVADITLDFLRAIYAKLHDLEAKIDAQTPPADLVCHRCRTGCPHSASAERKDGGREL
jgi:hypothetical protein